jgi:hypothetical protein
MALWKTDGKTIEHPLIEALIEIDVDPKTHAIRIRPRETEPQIYLKPFEEIDHRGVAGLHKADEDYFKSLAQQDTSEFSPFIRSSFEPVLRQAVTRLSASGIYYSDITPDPTDRRLPEVSDTLTVTDTWAIYARPRSGNFYVQDIERVKEQVDKSVEQNLPLSGRSFVTLPTDDQVYKPGIDLQGGIGSSSFTGRAQSHSTTTETPTLSDHDVLFPKPYNDAQIEIIRRLETAPGVVVQGPPGTGKTHTIANIICHYLATGRSVLVTSKGEPALEVLHDQIPVEVRNLTINLLTNEREGLKQLERAVTFLANDVMNKSPRQIEREIVDREQEIVMLRKEIDAVDAEVQRRAQWQLEPVPERIAGKPGFHPVELARRVAEDQYRHAWLEDSLTPEEEFEPRFTEQDIAAAREARRQLGPELCYLAYELPSPSDLPDTATICAVHEELMQAEALGVRASAQDIPPMSMQANDALSRAERLLESLRELHVSQSRAGSSCVVTPLLRCLAL